MSSRVDRIIEKAFLGGEFLTWLWWITETRDGRVNLDGQPLELFFEDLLVLESLLADSQENTFKGGDPSASEEAHLGLRLGKKVSKAKLRLRIDEREFAFTLRASTLDLATVKLPAVMSKAEDDQFHERLYLLEELERTLHGLYLAFLTRRVSEVWEQDDLPALRSWIAQSQKPVEEA